MNMTLSITIAAPELVGALNNLAVAFSGAAAHHVDTPIVTKTAKVKLAAVVQEVSAAPPAPDVPAVAQAPAAPLTIDQVKTLAAQKAKKVGAAVVKGIITDTGAATIADIADPLVLASLAANLEAL